MIQELATDDHERDKIDNAAHAIVEGISFNTIWTFTKKLFETFEKTVFYYSFQLNYTSC